MQVKIKRQQYMSDVITGKNARGVVDTKTVWC